MPEKTLTRYRSLRVVAGLVLTLALFGCDDSGVNGHSPDPPDYPIYFVDGTSTTPLYRYYPRGDSSTSVAMDALPYWDMTLSADGRELFVSEPYQTLVVDPVDGQKVDSLPFGRRQTINVSPDGKYVALVGSDSTTLLRIADRAVIFTGERLAGGVFSADSKRFFVIDSNGVSEYALGATFRFEQRRALPVDEVYRIRPSKDGRRWYLFTLTGPFPYGIEFVVYDVSSDAIIFRDLLSAGPGDIILTTDEQYVYYSYPGDLIEPSFSNAIGVYNALSGHRLPNIKTWAVTFDGDTIPFTFGEMVLTADGDYLVAAGFTGSYGLQIIDARRAKVLRFFGAEPGKGAFGLTTQLQPYDW